MFINNEVDLTKKKNGAFFLNNKMIEDDTTTPFYAYLHTIYQQMKCVTEDKRIEEMKKFRERELNTYTPEQIAFLSACGYVQTDAEGNVISVTVQQELSDEEKQALTVAGIGKLIDFFKEFDFQPNFRFLNTLSLKLQSKTSNEAKKYIQNYFSLIDSPYTNSVYSKMKSDEFGSIINNIRQTAPTKTVNERFKLYYGSQGTGKTTIAMQETANRIIVCNASMLPSDLMEDFVFVDGKATFKPSTLWRCMEEGNPITFDEINLLPFDSLRFLQGIVDGKKEFDYKGHTVHIKEGFYIIGTMNLTINGSTYGLPEPLVDRCSDIKEFTLTPQQLLSAII
jgi:hypothetical protein